jgi:hypothetical protein
MFNKVLLAAITAGHWANAPQPQPKYRSPDKRSPFAQSQEKPVCSVPRVAEFSLDRCVGVKTSDLAAIVL